MIGNNLLITGSSRFLNKINGSCTNGTTVSTQSQTTKFLREDGEWAAPSYSTFTDKYHTSGSWSGLTYTATANGGAGALAFTIPTGTTASTVCVGNDSRLSDARTPTSHTHGNIQNGGTLQTTDITIASGDKLVVTDSSDSSKVARTSISFDGSTATKCLTQKGTWETFGTSNLTIGTTSTTAMAGNTNVNNVTQTPTDSTNAAYELLFSGTADNTEHTEGVKKSSTLLYNPSQRTLAIGTSEVPISSRMSNTVVAVMHMTNTSSVGFGIDSSTGVASAGVSNSGKSLAASESDITLGGTSNTWDGTNASLKTAVTAAKGTVAQTATDSTDATYELLFSGTADNTTRTEGTRKSQYATFNPSKQAFTFGTRLSGSTVGSFSVAEGQNVTASGSGSHAEGKYTTASSEGSHAEGFNTTASNVNSHTEGSYTIASGIDSHAEGFHNTASGESSHAEGDYTTASGKYSHAEGAYTIANHKSQHVFGEYNVADASTAESTSRGNYIEIVGNGTGDSTRSNARTLDWDGNEWLAGSLTIKGSSIAYQGTANTIDMIRFVSSSDIYGHEIAIGGGGATIIGGGESPTVMMDQVTANDERMYIGNDSDVYIFANLQNGWENRRQFSFLSNGNLLIPGASVGVRNSNVALSYTNDNNGVTSPQYALYNALDANGQRFGYVQISADASGNTHMTIRSTNFKKGASSGTVDNSLVLSTSKAGAYTYSVTNATNFRTAIGAAAASSIKTKENISDLTEDEALKLLEIRPVSFDYKQGFDIDNKYERNYGVIAEETLDIIPSVVNVPTTEGWEFDETKGTNQELITVDYAKFVPYLIKLVQMQQQEIDELKKR